MSSTVTAPRSSVRSSAISAPPVPIRLVDPAKPRRIKVRLKGMSPLMLDPMSREVAEAMIQKKKIVIAHDRPLEQVCREKLDIIRDSESGRLALPRKYLWGCLHNAGEHVPYKGKMNIATSSQPGKPGKSRLAAFFMIEDKQFVLFNEDGEEPTWGVDVDVGNGATSKNGVCRPLLESWGFDLTFQYDDGDVNEQTIRKLFSCAGKLIGLGCRRACLKHGECGQFMIESWEDITPPDWPNAKVSKPKQKHGPKDEEPSAEDAE